MIRRGLAWFDFAGWEGNFGSMKPGPARSAPPALGAGLALLFAAGCGGAAGPTNAPSVSASLNMQPKVVKPDAEWRQQLTPEQYRILRQKGTERAYTGKFWNQQEKGDYGCAGCGATLFASDTKFDSGCGWPSFYAPAATNTIAEAADYSHGMVRTEVMCARCGGHLGHVFDDGPNPTGLRYCINSAALVFEKKEQKP